MTDPKLLADADRSVAAFETALNDLVKVARTCIDKGEDRTRVVAAVVGGLLIGAAFGGSTNTVGMLAVAVTRLAEQTAVDPKRELDEPLDAAVPVSDFRYPLGKGLPRTFPPKSQES